MRIFVSGRGTGKTTKTIEWFVVDWEHRLIITHSEQERVRLIKEIKRLYPHMLQIKFSRTERGHVWERHIQSYHNTHLLRGLIAMQPAQVRVDNLDLIIQGLIGLVTQGIEATSTEPWEVINEDTSN